MEDTRIAWAITGAGHALAECVDLLIQCEKVDVFLSRAGEEVLNMYNLLVRIHRPSLRIYRETHASAPLAGRFSRGIYRALIIAPATSNSVAKFVCGISDSLVTNLFAQAGKLRVPIVVYPTDSAPEIESVGPHGESIRVYPRPIDLANIEKLKTFAGIEVVCNREELARSLAMYKKPECR